MALNPPPGPTYLIGQQGNRLASSTDNSIDNSSDNSLVIRLDNSLDSSIDSSLLNRIGNRIAISTTLDRVGKTTAGVELRLSLIQQMGDTRRGVTGVADRGTKATARRHAAYHTAASVVRCDKRVTVR